MHQQYSIALSHVADQSPAMSQSKALKWVVTANFTSAGAVAYLRADKSVTRVLDEAACFATKEEAEAMRKVALGMEAIIADPYLMEVAELPTGLDPLTARERIRAQGPTIRLRRPDPRVQTH
jgi:hypothetical protein